MLGCQPRRINESSIRKLKIRCVCASRVEAQARLLAKYRDYTNKVAVPAFEPLVACAKCGSVEEPGAQLAACGWKLSRPAGSLIQ